MLVTASERLKAIGFKGLMPVRSSPRSKSQTNNAFGEEATAQETALAASGLKRRTRLVRKNKNHLKFPLYTDEQIGFSKDIPVVSDHNLIATDADEDYETDDDILHRTIVVCKKDVLFALKKINAAPNSYRLSLGNYEYQRDFRKL